MNKPIHLEATVEINSDRDLIEFPACESMKDYNSGRWTDDLDKVTCQDCLDLYPTGL